MLATTKKTIATYNMSYMSDKDEYPIPGFASEGNFLSQIPEIEKENNRRAFWKNALNLLKKFLLQENPIVVGLQEMNLTDCRSNTGTDAVEQMIIDFNKENNTSYKQVFKEYIVNENQKPALSIIFDKKTLGDVIASEIVDNQSQSGRPLLMVLTEQNYLLLNTHGLQDAAKSQNFNEFNDFNKTQVYFIQNQATNFFRNNIIRNKSNNLNGVLNGVILVGDFNDRFDQIQKFNILGKEMLQRYDAPKSCCYNYDSSCTDENFTRFFPDAPKDSKEYKYGLQDREPPRYEW